MRRWTLSIILVLLLGVGAMAAQDYSGTYTANDQGMTLTLVLKRSSDGTYAGNISSNTGKSYEIYAELGDDALLGVMGNEQTQRFFVAKFQGAKLQFIMIEKDMNGDPDFDNTKEYSFARGGNSGGSQPPPPSATPSKIKKSKPTYHKHSGSKGGSNSGGGVSYVSDDANAIGPNEAGDTRWGFKFTVPYGWNSNNDGNTILLDHSSLGVIVLFKHDSNSMEAVSSRLRQGVSSDDIQLSLVSNLDYLNNNVVAGDFTGTFQGERIRARGIGTLSPFGGGVYIYAINNEGVYSQQLIDVAENIARNITYFRPY